jgi:hypothetical protein
MYCFNTQQEQRHPTLPVMRLLADELHFLERTLEVTRENFALQLKNPSNFAQRHEALDAAAVYL